MILEVNQMSRKRGASGFTVIILKGNDSDALFIVQCYILHNLPLFQISYIQRKNTKCG